MFFFFSLQKTHSADFVIEIQGNLGHDGSKYRLDYYPPYGNPAPNTTIVPRDVGNEIQFSNGLPGTRYNFWLYALNDSYNNGYLSWTVSLTTRKYSIFFNYFKTLPFTGNHHHA